MFDDENGMTPAWSEPYYQHGARTVGVREEQKQLGGRAAHTIGGDGEKSSRHCWAKDARTLAGTRGIYLTVARLPEERHCERS